MRTAIYSPVSGTAVPTSEVPDETFSRDIIGPGVAIVPDSNLYVAPFDGVVTVLTKTLHAVCLRSDAGIDLLIHIGIDTVTLGGEGFESYVNQGDRVRKGDKLIRTNLRLCRKNGLDTISPCVIINSAELESFEPFYGKVQAGKTEIARCGHGAIKGE